MGSGSVVGPDGARSRAGPLSLPGRRRGDPRFHAAAGFLALASALPRNPTLRIRGESHGWTAFAIAATTTAGECSAAAAVAPRPGPTASDGSLARTVAHTRSTRGERRSTTVMLVAVAAVAAAPAVAEGCGVAPYAALWAALWAAL